MERVELWRDRFDEALERIQRYLSDDDKEMRRLSCWLTETKSNPYSFLEWGYARALDSAEQFAGLLQTIRHALLDDGDITFVAVNGRPMIVFAPRDEIGNVDLRTDVERQISEWRGTGVEYEFIDGVEMFIERVEWHDAHTEAISALLTALRNGEITHEEYRERSLASKEAMKPPAAASV